jgi:hypothetical protein
MRNFWKFQIRYRLARHLLQLAMWMFPPGKAKSELTQAHNEWSSRIYAHNFIERARAAARAQ